LRQGTLQAVWKDQQIVYAPAAKIKDAAQVTNRGTVAWHVLISRSRNWVWQIVATPLGKRREIPVPFHKNFRIEA
jgi:hypothetical protein